jgi:hypothetical protein
MSRPPADIDPRAIGLEFFRKLGGMEGMVKWGKTHRSLAYQLISKLMAQPVVINNTNNNVNIEAAGEAARQKLETAFISLIEARKLDGGTVYVDGERLDDSRVIEHQPRSADDSRRETADAAPSTADNGELNESSTSPKKGPLNARGGVATSTTGSTPTGGQKTNSHYSKSIPTFPGQTSAIALDGCDDNLSTTERFLLWRGHGGPP